MNGRDTTARRFDNVLHPDETMLTEAEIAELGLEEVPADAGLSLEEIVVARQRRPGHG